MLELELVFVVVVLLAEMRVWARVPEESILYLTRKEHELVVLLRDQKECWQRTWDSHVAAKRVSGYERERNRMRCEK